MAKNSFVLYYNYKDQLEDLTNEQIGELLRAIFDYEIDGLVPEFSSAEVRIAFKFIKKDLDGNKEKYEETCQKNRENADKRWQKNNATVCDRIIENANKCEQMRPDAKNADNDNVNDNDNECVSNDTHTVGARRKPQKHRFGKYKNVLLTDAEYGRLTALGNGLAAIEYLSEYRQMKGYKCNDDNLAIRKWVFTALEEQRQREARVNNQAAKAAQNQQQPTSNVFLNMAMQNGVAK